MVTEDLNFINKIKTRALAKKHLKEMKKIEINQIEIRFLKLHWSAHFSKICGKFKLKKFS